MVMDRRLFLAMAGGLLASPVPARALPAAPARADSSCYNAHTRESFDGPYRDGAGPIAAAMEELSHLLRDHHSGERIAIDVGVLDFLAAVMDAVGAGRATVLSAYRTVATNRMLARTTFGVADNSQHLYGRALDIRLEGRLEDAMQTARKMQRGGVGWYPRSRLHPSRHRAGAQLDARRAGFRRAAWRRSSSCWRAPACRRRSSRSRAHRPLNVKQRLALHRVIAKAMTYRWPRG